MIFRILFFDRFWRFKSVLGSFFAFFAKIWPKNMYCSSKSRNYLFDLFHLVTWDYLDLYYGHKAQEMILTDVSDTIHADSLALFAFNIEILLADVTKPEKSKTLTLTWPVTSSVTSGSNFLPCTGSSRRVKWGKMCHGVNKSTPFSQLLLFQSPPFFYWRTAVTPCFLGTSYLHGHRMRT